MDSFENIISTSYLNEKDKTSSISFFKQRLIIELFGENRKDHVVRDKIYSEKELRNEFALLEEHFNGAINILRIQGKLKP